MEDDKKISIPTTRYTGSKAKIVNWIWDNIKDLDFESVLDLFGGTGVVGYVAKANDKKVIYNDYLKFNQFIGKALIQNNNETLNKKDLDIIFAREEEVYPSFIKDNFKDIYFTNEENEWLDRIVFNISNIKNENKKAVAYYCLFQSCIRKRPYNLFHRKNLYVRFADVKRSFGNKKTWDTPFETHFKDFVNEINPLIINNNKDNIATNYDSFEIPEEYYGDLIYLDPPYISEKNIGVDYKDFYHFLEGICLYNEWDNIIDRESKHLRLKKEKNIWHDKKLIYDGFDRLFKKFKDKIIVVSYRSDGVPTESDILNLLRKYKKNVKVVRKNFKYALSHKKNEELLFIGS